MATAVAGAGLGATALGGVVGAVGSIFGGSAQSSAYNYQAQIAAMNAQIAKQNANYDLAVGEVQAQQQGMKTRAQIGATRAQQGASGLDVNSGTNVNVRSSEAEIGAEDQALIRNKAAYTAYGQEVTAAQDTAQAQLDQMSASNAQTAGMLGAATSILGAGGSFASQWTKANAAGVF
jgi:multidrug resistance efflux pump